MRNMTEAESLEWTMQLLSAQADLTELMRVHAALHERIQYLKTVLRDADKE